MNQRLSILVEEDEILPAPQAAGGALQSGLLALGTVMPQTLALVGIAYAPLVLLGVHVNPLWVIWSAVAGIALMFVLTRERGVIYGVRPGAALLYASTLTTCASLAREHEHERNARHGGPDHPQGIDLDAQQDERRVGDAHQRQRLRHHRAQRQQAALQRATGGLGRRQDFVFFDEDGEALIHPPDASSRHSLRLHPETPLWLIW